MAGAVWGRLIGIFGGIAVGGAAREAIDPILEPAKQNAWARRPNRVLDPASAAAIRARQTRDVGGEVYPGIDLEGVGLGDDARRHGLGSHRFNLLTELAREHPTVADLQALRRRRLALGGAAGIGQAEYREWMRRQGFTTEIIEALTKLLVEYLPPADVANAVQQGFMPDDGILPPTTAPQPDWVESDGAFGIPVEQLDIDPSNEAAVHGFDKSRLKILAELVGLPPGEETLLDMWRRGMITEKGYAAGLREGHTKTKWTAALSARFYNLLPTSVLVNLRLRGWIEDADYHARMRKHGYRPSQADDYFHALGRPATALQALKGTRRGGVYDGPTDHIPPWFQHAVRQSDLRNEWMNILWAGRETYPSAFVMRRLVADEAVTPTEAAQLLYENAWPQNLAKASAATWARGTATTAKGMTRADLLTEYEGGFLSEAALTADLEALGYTAAQAARLKTLADARIVRTERAKRIRLIGSRYVAHRITRDRALAELDAAEIDAAAAARVLAEWDVERSLTADALTPAQIKKAYKATIFDRPTAVARLAWKGYDEGDAGIFLDES